MDIAWLGRQILTSQEIKGVPGNPFLRRPWLQDKAAAAPAATNIGVKGIIAGNFFFFTNYSYLPFLLSD